MIVNRKTLLELAPIKNMLTSKVVGEKVSHGLTEAGYDIRLKQDVHFTSRIIGGHREPVVRVGNANGTIDMVPGRFTLASAIEEFDVPTCLVGIVHDKSSWARRGLSVLNTAIEPGWKGFLTLELVYHGTTDLYLPAGSGIAQVLFHHLSNDAAYNGKYQNQADQPVPAK